MKRLPRQIPDWLFRGAEPKSLASDLLVLAGLVAFAVGLWWIYPPACLLFSGAALAAVGMLMGGKD